MSQTNKTIIVGEDEKQIRWNDISEERYRLIHIGKNNTVIFLKNRRV